MTIFIALAIGFVFSFLFPQFSFFQVPGYEFALYAFLGVGLYGAVYSIELKEFHVHKMLILRAITLGVLLKSFIIGGIFWLFFQSPYAFLFAVIVAQIDPLAVAHLIDNKSSKFSTKGRTILRAWSSFDDPMTVLLALYVFIPLSVSTGARVFEIETYFVQLVANLFFAGLIYVLSKQIKSNKVKLCLLAIAFIVAVYFKLMLGIAIVGLFLRPYITQLSLLIRFAFIAAALLLGSLLEFTTMYVVLGVVLGVSAFFSQAVVTWLIAAKLSLHDKIFLSAAQYNGITAIILALVIAQWVPQTLSIIAIAIIVINLLYHVTNWIIEKRLG